MATRRRINTGIPIEPAASNGLGSQKVDDTQGLSGHPQRSQRVEAAAGASPKVAKCLAASVTTRTNGVNACTDGVRRGDAEWIYSAPSRNGLKSRREDLVHRVCAQPMFRLGLHRHLMPVAPKAPRRPMPAMPISPASPGTSRPCMPNRCSAEDHANRLIRPARRLEFIPDWPR